MSVINLSLKHGRTQEEARGQLEKVVHEVSGRFASLVHRVDWSDDRNAVTVAGNGFEARMWVDADSFHLTGDIPLLGTLFSGPLGQALRGIAERHFPPRLT